MQDKEGRKANERKRVSETSEYRHSNDIVTAVHYLQAYSHKLYNKKFPRTHTFNLSSNVQMFFP